MGSYKRFGFAVIVAAGLALAGGAGTARSESAHADDVKFELPVSGRSTAWGKYCENEEYKRIADRKAHGGAAPRNSFLAMTENYCSGWKLHQAMQGLLMDKKPSRKKQQVLLKAACDSRVQDRFKGFNKTKAAIYGQIGFPEQERISRGNIETYFLLLEGNCKDKNWKDTRGTLDMIGLALSHVFGEAELKTALAEATGTVQVLKVEKTSPARIESDGRDKPIAGGLQSAYPEGKQEIQLERVSPGSAAPANR